MRIKKIVKSRDCFKCQDPCCRFQKEEISFAPIFTEPEFKKLKTKDKNQISFQKYRNSEKVFQVRLVESGKKDIYLCPFLDSSNQQCRIYKRRPLDCRLFPLVIMKSKDGQTINLCCYNELLCSALRNISPEKFEKYKKYLSKWCRNKKTVRLAKGFPEIVWDYDEDTVIISEIK